MISVIQEWYAEAGDVHDPSRDDGEEQAIFVANCSGWFSPARVVVDARARFNTSCKADDLTSCRCRLKKKARSPANPNLNDGRRRLRKEPDTSRNWQSRRAGAKCSCADNRHPHQCVGRTLPESHHIVWHSQGSRVQRTRSRSVRTVTKICTL